MGCKTCNTTERRIRRDGNCISCHAKWKYRNDPAYRDKKRKQSAKWSRDNRDRKNAYQREYYARPGSPYKAAVKRDYKENRELRISQIMARNSRRYAAIGKAYGIGGSQAEYQMQKLAKEIKARRKKCSRCGSRENLEIHHIRSRTRHPELALEPDNIRLLCRRCHRGFT